MRHVAELIRIQLKGDSAGFELLVVDVNSAEIVFENGSTARLLLVRRILLVVFGLQRFRIEKSL